MITIISPIFFSRFIRSTLTLKEEIKEDQKMNLSLFWPFSPQKKIFSSYSLPIFFCRGFK